MLADKLRCLIPENIQFDEAEERLNIELYERELIARVQPSLNLDSHFWEQRILLFLE
jgi:hypothetical protein